MFLKHNFLVLITTVVLTTRGLVKGQACIYTISDTNGVLDYPVGDGNYTNNVNCTWKFIAPFGRSVEVTFTSIDLQPMFLDLFCVDSVTVYDGVPGSTLFTFPFCGGGPSWPRKPYRFVSSSNILSITMSTDQSLTGTGFVAEYKHVPFRRESIAAINVEVPSIIQFNRFASRLFEAIPLLQSNRPSALDFDPITGFFYYTDIDVGFIGRIMYDASSDEILVEENVQTPAGVAVGYLTGLLYWTDLGRDEVSVSRLDGTFRKVLVFSNTGCNSPKAIALSSDQQNVFWTCAGKIMKAKADGTEGQTLVDGLNDPRTIVQDEEMFLYWVDVATSSVGRIRTDGSMEEELFNHNVFTGVHSFVLDSFTYYWSRPADKDIIDVDRHNPNLIGTLSVKDAVTMEGLYYFKSDQPIAPQHTCATDQAQCRELCFPRGPSYRCVEVTPVVVNCPNEIVITTSQMFQQVSWDEPYAMSRTSQPDREMLMYHTRMPMPGAIFAQGNTTVKYTFKDEFSNTAICSFNVVLLPATTTVTTTVSTTATTTVTTTVSTTATTTKPTDDIISSKSPDFSLDLLITEYLIYTILGIVIVLLCVIILIVVCVTCCCRCSCRSNSRREASTMQSQPTNFAGYDNKGAINMVPVGGGMSHGYPSVPFPHTSY